MEKILYLSLPVRGIIPGPSDRGKTVFLTNLILNILNECNKIYFHSPSLHQDLYQNLIKCFNNYIPINMIPITLNEENIESVIHEIVNN